MLSQRKSLFFFFFLIFIQLFCSLAQELTVGVVTRLLLPTYCRASQELHHLASADQLSGNTFAFTRLAQAPSRFSPAPWHRARGQAAPGVRGAPCWGTLQLVSHGHLSGTIPNPPATCPAPRIAPALGESLGI